MNHAKETSIRNQRPYTMYECGDCGGIHIGQLGPGESVFMYGGYSENIRRLQEKDWNG